MAHEISIAFSKKIPVLNSDIRIVVKQDKQKLGTLTISKGTIDWLPRNAKSGKGSEIKLTWAQFADAMEATRK